MWCKEESPFLITHSLHGSDSEIHTDLHSPLILSDFQLISRTVHLMAKKAFVARVNLRVKSELAQYLGAMDVVAVLPKLVALIPSVISYIIPKFPAP